MKRLVFAVALVLLPGTAKAGDPNAECLRGVTRVSVGFDELTKDLEKEGVTKSQLRTDVELKLRKAGLTVEETATPQLYVQVAAIKYDKLANVNPFYALDVSVSLKENVTVERNKTRMFTVTWHSGTTLAISGAPAARVREIVAQRVDEFLSTYLSVNPPSKPVKD